MTKNSTLTENEQAELIMTDNPRTLTEHATYDHPVLRVTLLVIKQGTPEHEKKRLLELSHKLALTQNK